MKGDYHYRYYVTIRDRVERNCESPAAVTTFLQERFHVLRESPWLMHFFGRAEYQREKPVMSDSIRSQAQPIVDAMNSGTITVEDGLRQLDEIWY